MPLPGSTASGPLTRLRVLDISAGLAGPFAAKLLADLGADVIRIEPPGQSADDSAAATYTGTSKRSLTADLGRDEGRTLLFELLRTHDIVISSETEPALAARGLGYSGLAAANPRAILTTVTGFGSTGPYAGFASSHLVTCALSGWANACGLPGREPIQAGGNVTEFVAGAYAAVGTLAAHEHRQRDGLGQHVDVSAMEAAITAALLPTMVYEYAGALPERNSVRTTGPSWMMECSDGYVGANTLTQPQWETMCHFLGLPELLDEPAYATPAERLALAAELHARISPWFRERSASEVFHDAQAWRIPFGLVPSLTDLLSMEQLVDRQFFVQLPDTTGRQVMVPGVPFRMPASPSAPASPPRHGEHTEEVLTSLLGLSPAEVAALRAEGVC
jgi:crotonobetainyl-CoA:carnitine CoA-transferase CaiB-like acyl-CoA transferase